MTSKRTSTLFSEVEPPEELFKAVLSRIALARRRAARLRLAALGSGLLISGTLVVSSIGYAINEFYASGFYEYLSLFFSDRSIVFAHWKEISLSLAEALPSIAILMCMAFSVVFIWSLRHAVRNARLSFRPI